MIYDEKTARQVANFLLEKKAVILRPDNPFTWASGWKSPIYCDNRLLLSYPDVRTYIKLKLGEIVKVHFPEAQSLVGVATAGIAHAALAADQINLPMAYARSKMKDHGRQNIIEGKINKDAPVVVIEDLISTGKSSFFVVDMLKAQNINVLGLCAIFSYDFPISAETARNAGVPFYTLTDYNILLSEAFKMGYIKSEDVVLLKTWRQAPDKWGR